MRQARGQCRIVSPVALSLRPRGKREGRAAAGGNRATCECCAWRWCLCVGMATPAVAEPSPPKAWPTKAWPPRPIKLVVPFSAAGTADLLARLVADRLGPVLGQPVV